MWLISLSCLGNAQSTSLFVAKENAFKVQFPGEPEHSAERTVSQYGVIWQNVYIHAEGEQAWMVAYTDYPEGMLDGQTEDEVLNQGVSESLSTLDIGSPIELNSFSTGGFPGRSFKGMRGRNYVYFRLLLVNERLYQLTALRLDAWPDERRVEHFFTSFQLPEGLNANRKPEVYQSESGQYTIRFPGAPNTSSDTVLADVGPITMHSCQFENRDGVAYMVSYADYPQSMVDTRDKRELLQSGKRTVVRSMELSALDVEEEVLLGDHPGLDFQGHSESYYVVFRVFMVGNRLYQIAMMREGEYVSEEERVAFMESFQLLMP